MEQWQYGMKSKKYGPAVHGYPPAKRLFELEQQLMTPLISPETQLVEIGCGPGVACLPFAGKAKSIFAIDFSKNAIDAFQEVIETTVHKNHRGCIFPILGNAGELDSLLQNHSSWNQNLDSPRLFLCVMNTFGTLSPTTRPATLHAIRSLYRPQTDAFFLVTFNARDFYEKGINGFYQSASMTGLVGEIKISTEESYTLDNDSYYSHWFSDDEIKELLEGAGFGECERKEDGFAQLTLVTDNSLLKEIYTTTWSQFS